MTKTQISAEVVERALDHSGAYDVRVYKDYSGRGMYGDTCFGLVGTERDIVKVIVSMAGETAANGDDFQFVYDMLDRMSTDQHLLLPRVRTRRRGLGIRRRRLKKP